MNTIIKILASGFGTGYLPLASGTWGSALAALISFYLFPENSYARLVVVAAVLAVSVPVCTKAEILYGKKDDSRIVLDEFVGFWVSVLFLPDSMMIYLAAFLIFRVLDVIKPFFIRTVQSWRGGWGIVADDLFAGIFTNLLVQIFVIVYSRV